MVDEQMMKKPGDWLQSNPESADTRLLNVSTGGALTVRTLLSNPEPEPA
ncbi:MAG: hypothetical protein ACK46L_13000 [Synechococcaceae cyanobacterium]|jgi:hypothetical protein